jgi:hypothetical protein
MATKTGVIHPAGALHNHLIMEVTIGVTHNHPVAKRGLIIIIAAIRVIQITPHRRVVRIVIPETIMLEDVKEYSN